MVYVENMGCDLDDFDKVYEDFQESFACYLPDVPSP